MHLRPSNENMIGCGRFFRIAGYLMAVWLDFRSSNFGIKVNPRGCFSEKCVCGACPCDRGVPAFGLDRDPLENRADDFQPGCLQVPRQYPILRFFEKKLYWVEALRKVQYFLYPGPVFRAVRTR